MSGIRRYRDNKTELPFHGGNFVKRQFTYFVMIHFVIPRGIDLYAGKNDRQPPVL